MLMPDSRESAICAGKAEYDEKLAKRERQLSETGCWCRMKFDYLAMIMPELD